MLDCGMSFKSCLGCCNGNWGEDSYSQSVFLPELGGFLSFQLFVIPNSYHSKFLSFLIAPVSKGQVSCPPEAAMFASMNKIEQKPMVKAYIFIPY